MQKPVDDFKDYLVGDVLGHISGVTAKKMFGGYGLYLDGNIFGLIISDETVCFKVDDTNRTRYEALDSEPFVYTGHKNKKPTTMPYWSVPETVLENRELVEELVYESAAITKASKK